MCVLAIAEWLRGFVFTAQGLEGISAGRTWNFDWCSWLHDLQVSLILATIWQFTMSLLLQHLAEPFMYLVLLHSTNVESLDLGIQHFLLHTASSQMVYSCVNLRITENLVWVWNSFSRGVKKSARDVKSDAYAAVVLVFYMFLLIYAWLGSFCLIFKTDYFWCRWYWRDISSHQVKGLRLFFPGNQNYRRS
jgi:hypothetical protein